MADVKIPKAPLHLGAAGKRLWRRVQAAYIVDGFQLDVLEAACTAADRLEQARQQIAAEGLTVEHPKLGIRPHPAVAIETAARTGMLRALRELALSDEAAAESPRPPSIAGRYVRTGA